MYIYTHTCICINICICIYTYIYIYIYIYIHISKYCFGAEPKSTGAVPGHRGGGPTSGSRPAQRPRGAAEEDAAQHPHDSCPYTYIYICVILYMCVYHIIYIFMDKDIESIVIDIYIYINRYRDRFTLKEYMYTYSQVCRDYIDT